MRIALIWKQFSLKLHNTFYISQFSQEDIFSDFIKHAGLDNERKNEEEKKLFQNNVFFSNFG